MKTLDTVRSYNFVRSIMDRRKGLSYLTEQSIKPDEAKRLLRRSIENLENQGDKILYVTWDMSSKSDLPEYNGNSYLGYMEFTVEPSGSTTGYHVQGPMEVGVINTNRKPLDLTTANNVHLGITELHKMPVHQFMALVDVISTEDGW